jgi:hypothetical protein
MSVFTTQDARDPVARNMRLLALMSIGFVFGACAFALVVGCAVACVDWWREARRALRLRAAVPVRQDAKPARPAAHRRAA